jgi:flavin-dependent dehydrogenase
VGGLPLIEDYGSHLKEYDERHTARRSPNVVRVIRKHGYLLPCRRPGAPVQRGRAMLVGDAAGLVEAFTGEGIFWAIKSGQLAARAILKDGGKPQYQDRLDRALMPDLLSARRWLRVYVWVPRACYTLPKRVPVFWRAVCAIMRGERRYTHIRRMLGPLGLVEELLPDPLLSLK